MVFIETSIYKYGVLYAYPLVVVTIIGILIGALLIIPLTNVRTISISPAPNNLAGHTVINARQV